MNAIFLNAALQLERGGPPWQIVTCHFTHWTYEQLAWDALAFLTLGIACARRHRGAFCATLLASIVVVPLAVLAFAPEVIAYRGLSGLDSALFMLLIALEARHNQWMLALGLAFGAKIAYELTTGSTIFVGSVTPVPVAHVAGALTALAVVAAGRRQSSRRNGGAPGAERRRPRRLVGRRLAASLAPLLFTGCGLACLTTKLDVDPPRGVDPQQCAEARDLAGDWTGVRKTMLGPAVARLRLGSDCRFHVSFTRLLDRIVDSGTWAVENGDQIRFRRTDDDIVWLFRRESRNRVRFLEEDNEWHTYSR